MSAREPWLMALLLAVAGAACAAQPPPEAGTVVRRTTLIVHDIDASIRFYRDILGFSVWLENRAVVSAASLPVDLPPGTPSRFVIMKGRDPWIGMIGLLQYGSARPLPPRPRAVRPGDAVLMIETSELEAIYRRIRAAGVSIQREPETNQVTGAGGAKWMATFLFAFDPDGHVLEINQRQPVAAVPPTATTAPATAEPPGAVTVRRAFADTRLGQLHYREAGPSSRAPARYPLVLLHMSPLSGRMFSEVLPALATDRRVYAPDTPGYGESDAPRAPPSIGDYADALHDFIAGLGTPVDLLGYHTGAMIAGELAVRYPGDVRRLVLVSYPLFTPEQRASLSSASPISTDGTYLLKEWQNTMAVRPNGQSLEQAARIVAEKFRAGNKAGWAMHAIQDYDAEPRLRLITQSTLIVRAKDGLWEAGGACAALIGKARLQDEPQWSYGLFDAYPKPIRDLVLGFLDQD